MAATKTINGRTYSFGDLAPTDALRVEVAIVRVIGEPLFKAFMDLKPARAKPALVPADSAPEKTTAKASEEDKQAAAMAAMGMLAAKMDAEELITTFTLILKYVTCEGQRTQLDVTFMGRNRDLWLVIVEALRINFSDFFPASLFGSLKDKLAL